MNQVVLREIHLSLVVLLTYLLIIELLVLLHFIVQGFAVNI